MFNINIFIVISCDTVRWHWPFSWRGKASEALHTDYSDRQKPQGILSRIKGFNVSWCRWHPDPCIWRLHLSGRRQELLTLAPLYSRVRHFGQPDKSFSVSPRALTEFSSKWPPLSIHLSVTRWHCGTWPKCNTVRGSPARLNIRKKNYN